MNLQTIMICFLIYHLLCVAICVHLWIQYGDIPEVKEQLDFIQADLKYLNVRYALAFLIATGAWYAVPRILLDMIINRGEE